MKDETSPSFGYFSHHWDKSASKLENVVINQMPKRNNLVSFIPSYFQYVDRVIRLNGYRILDKKGKRHCAVTNVVQDVRVSSEGVSRNSRCSWKEEGVCGIICSDVQGFKLLGDAIYLIRLFASKFIDFTRFSY